MNCKCGANYACNTVQEKAVTKWIKITHFVTAFLYDAIYSIRKRTCPVASPLFAYRIFVFLKETADERHLNCVLFGNTAAEYHQTNVNRRACNASAE